MYLHMISLSQLCSRSRPLKYPQCTHRQRANSQNAKSRLIRRSRFLTVTTNHAMHERAPPPVHTHAPQIPTDPQPPLCDCARLILATCATVVSRAPRRRTRLASPRPCHNMRATRLRLARCTPHSLASTQSHIAHQGGGTRTAPTDTVVQLLAVSLLSGSAAATRTATCARDT